MNAKPNLFKLCDWEENRYDDSDFMMAVWDDAAGRAVRVEVGSTRYASNGGDHNYAYPTPEVVDRAVRWLAGVIFDQLRSAEHADVLEPSPERVVKGTQVRLLAAVRFTDKKRGAPPVDASAGEVGEVIWAGAFGTFYRNGYNKPNRENTRVGIRFADGRVVFTKMANVRLDREPMADAELRSRAENIAEDCNFKAAVSNFGGWLSCNWAYAVRRGPEAVAEAKRRGIPLTSLRRDWAPAPALEAAA